MCEMHSHRYDNYAEALRETSAARGVSVVEVIPDISTPTWHNSMKSRED